MHCHFLGIVSSAIYVSYQFHLAGKVSIVIINFLLVLTKNCLHVVGCCSIVQSFILQHFSWVENATVVKVPQLQGDQIGESLSMDRPEPKFALFLHSQFF